MQEELCLGQGGMCLFRLGREKPSTAEDDQLWLNLKTERQS